MSKMENLIIQAAQKERGNRCMGTDGLAPIARRCPSDVCTGRRHQVATRTVGQAEHDAGARIATPAGPARSIGIVGMPAALSGAASSTSGA